MVSSIYSTTSNVTSAVGRKGLAGLASGMDTDQLIEAMTARTRSKIAQIKQKQTAVGWKQEAYRSVTSMLQDFKNKYLNATSSSNMLSASFFQSATFTSSGKYASAVSMTGSINSAMANFTVREVESLAKTAAFTSTVSASANEITTGDLTNIVNKPVLSSALEGETIGIEFGGTTYTLNLSNVKVDGADATVNAGHIAKAINDQINGTALKDKISASVTGNGEIQFNVADGTSEMKIVGVGNKIRDALGFTASDDISGTSFTGSKAVAIADTVNTQSYSDSLIGKSITFNLNDISKTITFRADRSINSVEDLKSFLQEELDSAFNGKITVGDSASGLSFKTADNSSILSIATGDEAALKGTGLEVGQANRLLLSRPITSTNVNAETADLMGALKSGGKQDITVNGTTFSVYSNKIVMNENGSGEKTYSFESGTSISNIMSTINSANVGVKIQYNSTADNFAVQATESGTMGKAEVTGALADALFGAAGTRTVQNAQDAVLKVSFDGVSETTITRTTNNFNLNGMNLTVNNTFKAEAADEYVTFSSKMNTDKIVDNIKEMIGAYNDIIAKVNKEITTKHDRNYVPLSEEQRKDMSESEIKLWEEKAKTGLLFSDPTLSSLATDIRFALSMPVGDSALSSIGLSVSSNWQDNGKINIDESKLRAAIEANPEKVRDIFTQSSSGTVSSTSTDAGVMQRLNSVISKYAGTMGTKGLLLQRAGHESSPLSMADNALYREIKEYDRQLTTWTRKLASEEARYAKQFSSLEVYISKMNEQSSWLQSATGG